MAREKRSRRDESEDAGLPASRGNRIPQGPSFAMSVGFMSGGAAAVLAFVAALAGGGIGAADPYEALDMGGVQAARLFASPGTERWSKTFGTVAAMRARVKEQLDKRVEAAKDDREKQAIKRAIDEFSIGKASSGVDWRPGFDLVMNPADPGDATLLTNHKRFLEMTLGGDPNLIAAGIMSGTTPLVAFGTGSVADSSKLTPSRKFGSTNVYAFAGSRQYEHPVPGPDGTTAARAVVLLSTGAVKPSSPLATAGLAALGALIGGFAVGFLIALGPVKAIRRLAQDAGDLADGQLDTRVAVGGPDVVQAAAKNVQRLAQLAASGAMAAPAEPQIIQQQVMVQPVAEVQEGLSPLKGFRRPEELEIEATQKPCPDLGNDYYDLINVDDDHVGVFVADIPNMRGVRGAMFMSQIRALFRAVSPREQSPAEVLRLLNRTFSVDLPRGIYVTAMYAVVNRTTGICRVASAQHLPLVFWKLSKKASARLAPEGIALGLDPGAVFDKTIVEKTVQLEKGDRIVLYTDGAISAKNLAGAQYGDERFYYVVNREAPKNSAACVNFVANDVDLFHEGAAQTDDFTIVTLRKLR